MHPGEYLLDGAEVELNAGRADGQVLWCATRGDRPVQVGSHYHFFEVNSALEFDRASARGMRLDIAAGTAIRFEPGEEKEVYAGRVRRQAGGLRASGQSERVTMNERQESRAAPTPIFTVPPQAIASAWPTPN